MPLDVLTVGRTTSVHRDRIDPDRALAFALATDDANPGYHSGRLAPPLAGVHATTGAVLELYGLLFDDLSMLQLVHLAEDVRFHRPLVPGTETDTVARAEAVRRTPAGAAVYLHTATTDTDGRPLLETRAVVLVPGRNGVEEIGELPPDDRPPGLRRDRHMARSLPGGTRPGGRSLAPTHRIDVPVAPDQALRFCAASGDWQPIHFDERSARAAGLPGVVLHGMCTLALACREAVAGLAGGDPARMARVAARFAGPVRPGQTLTVGFSPGTPGSAAGGSAGGGSTGETVYALRVDCRGKSVLRNGRVHVRP